LAAAAVAVVEFATDDLVAGRQMPGVGVSAVALGGDRLFFGVRFGNVGVGRVAIARVAVPRDSAGVFGGLEVVADVSLPPGRSCAFCCGALVGGGEGRVGRDKVVDLW
jgi:hypothetical protein